MLSRGPKRIRWAFLTLAVVCFAASQADAWDQKYKYPSKVRTSATSLPESAVSGVAGSSRGPLNDWEAAAGQARREILCPKRGYAFALGMRPFFATLAGSTKVISKGGEGTFLSLTGHLRLPSENTLWELYANIRVWDKLAVKLEYLPWEWAGPGHVSGEGNFGGLLLRRDDSINSSLSLSSLVLGGDYEVSFGRDLVFGPNADLYLLKWTQKVSKNGGESMDFAQTIVQPTIGGHLRYEPSNTGYFSWFKPFFEGRFSWMSFSGLGLSIWDVEAGIAPPVSRNVDAGVKLGYRQWRLEGSRNRLFADVSVEGPYLDFSLQF